jgi:hypothetical protein
MTINDIPPQMLMQAIEVAVREGAERLFWFQIPNGIGITNHINGCGPNEPFAIIKVADYLDKGQGNDSPSPN